MDKNTCPERIKRYSITNFATTVKKVCDSDDPPTEDLRGIRQVLLRVINKKQILILNSLDGNNSETISSLLRRLSEEHMTPLSTLKANSKVLKDLNLISYGNNSDFQTARITDTGKVVIDVLRKGESCKKS